MTIETVDYTTPALSVLGTVPGLAMALIPWGVCLWGTWTRRRQRYLLIRRRSSMLTRRA